MDGWIAISLTREQNRMTADANSGSQWDRVAAELRACREAQHRAWGDIDNTTLGRFLAGEVTSEEQQQIENALNHLPELRKLTDLVRDVLGETEQILPEPAAVPSIPHVLPFPQPQARTLVPAPASSRAAKPWYRDGRVRQRIGLAMAACLLLALGVTMPASTGLTKPESGPSLASAVPMADRTLPFEVKTASLNQTVEGKDELPSQRSNVEPGRETFLFARIDDSLQHLEAEGKKQEASLLARQYAANLTRQALLYQEKGDLASAEPALQEACQLCAKTFGPESPQTVRTRQSLAGVYEVALNTASSPASEWPLDVATKRPVPRLMAAPPPPSAPPIQSALGYAHPATALHERPMTYDASYGGYSPKYARPHHPKQTPSHRSPQVVLRDQIIRRGPEKVKASVVPVLTLAFREAKNSTERQRFARALGQLGPAAREAAPLLLSSCCRATDASERATLLLVLARIGPGELRQTLMPYLRQKDFDGGVQASRRFLPDSERKPVEK
jgi:hypothetical protein